METPTLISLLALCISFLALYRSHLLKFIPETACGTPRVSIIPCKSEKCEWYLHRIYIPIEISNIGARSGVVMGLRVIARYPDVKIKNNYEVLTPVNFIEKSKYSKLSGIHPFDWNEEGLKSWNPFVIAPKQTIDASLVFQCRWENPVIQKNINLELQCITSSKNKWKTVEKWKHNLDPLMWNILTSSLRSIGIAQKEVDLFDTFHSSDELRKKIEVKKEKIPKGKLEFKPTETNYDKDVT
jgi:hypothetical protein